MFLVVIATALAGDATHYNPESIASSSTLFQRAAEAMGPKFDGTQSELTRTGQALELLEVGVALLGSDTPAATADWAEAARRSATGQFLQIQKHVNLVQDDYAQIFGEAITRALEAMDQGDAQECQQSAGGSFGASFASGKTCEGEDISEALTKKLDADPQLASDVDEINAVPWPSVKLDPHSAAPVAATGTSNWILLSFTADQIWPTQLDQRRKTLDGALLELGVGLDNNDARSLAATEKSKAAYLEGLAADGTVLRGALAASLERGAKKGGPTDVGFCANPPELGGCAGTDVTEQALDWFRSDKKLQKALR